MICEKILGTLEGAAPAGKTVEYVDIGWDEAFKKIHKKTSDAGTEVGIRFDDSILTRGLQEGDILYEDDARVIAVRIPPCDVIRVTVAPDHSFMVAKVCYEIGNRHAPLFYGDAGGTFITPYDEPVFRMLSKLHGVTAEKRTQKLDFSKRISSGIPGHHHH